MRPTAIVVALALLLAVALAVFAPAALLDARLDTATQGRLRLADTSGTVWNGRGVATDAQRTWSLPLGWKVDPLRLARGDVGVTLLPAEAGDLPRGVITWRDATLSLDGIAFTLPATVLGASTGAGNLMAFGGFLAFDAPHLSWSANGGDGSATVRWSGARVSGIAGNVALGTVSANLAPRNGRIEGRVENHGGDVRIDGDFAWSPAAIEVNATLAALPSAPPGVVRALGALGSPDATGAVHLQWRSGSR
jgi:general secretion pathway protein N